MWMNQINYLLCTQHRKSYLSWADNSAKFLHPPVEFRYPSEVHLQHRNIEGGGRFFRGLPSLWRIISPKERGWWRNLQLYTLKQQLSVHQRRFLVSRCWRGEESNEKFVKWYTMAACIWYFRISTRSLRLAPLLSDNLKRLSLFIQYFIIADSNNWNIIDMSKKIYIKWSKCGFIQ